MSENALLISTLVELADSLVDDFDVVELLTLLSERSVQAFDVASAAVTLGLPSGQLHVIAASSDAMRDLELFELQCAEGPCVDSYRSGRPAWAGDLAVDDVAWPRFAGRAVEAGLRSVHSLPLRLRAETIGTLSLMRTSPGALADTDLAAAQAFADVATIAIVQHQAMVDAQAINSQLQHALNSRIIIEQAKGKIAESAGVDMAEAFQRLRQHARAHHLLLAELAEAVVNGSFPAGAFASPSVPPRS